MTARHYSWRQIIKQHPFIATGIIVGLLALIVLIIAVVLSNGTGFNGYTVKSTATETTISSQTKVTTTEQSQPGKTLWDLLQLLAALAIPVVVGFGAAWFTAQQGKVSDRENRDNQRETALQAYIDKMSELLLAKDNLLRESKPEDEVRKIARVRTLTVLRRLDAERKGSVLEFLQESDLIGKDKRIIELTGANLRGVDLSGANLYHTNLSGANLFGANLYGANLYGANLDRAVLGRSAPIRSKADLEKANLTSADLSRASLRGANLSGVNLSEANLIAANLRKANLSGVDLSRADLREAGLYGADLSGANLSGADLRSVFMPETNLFGAILYGADLSRADLKSSTGISIEELNKQVKSLQGATMPDGSIHP